MPHHPLLAVGRLEDASTEPLSEMDLRQRELYAKQQQLLREQRTADQEKLLAAIGVNLGFHDRRPVAALTIFRCCLQWKTFQADRTPLFDRIIATMGSQVGATGGGAQGLDSEGLKSGTLEAHSRHAACNHASYHLAPLPALRWSCIRRTTPCWPTGCPTPSRCCT